MLAFDEVNEGNKNLSFNFFFFLNLLHRIIVLDLSLNICLRCCRSFNKIVIKT